MPGTGRGAEGLELPTTEAQARRPTAAAVQSRKGSGQGAGRASGEMTGEVVARARPTAQLGHGGAAGVRSVPSARSKPAVSLAPDSNQFRRTIIILI
jgi:hypothetical protein